MRQNPSDQIPAGDSFQTPLRDLWHEVLSTGLFEVSSGERFVEQMIDRIERRP
ncbi:hypothetical protein RGUI_1949 [Rhodovulum sp. P5]|uniref:hypothetical protein n=1 Tax=Rhodovulum sp. P5 TaxID=1564506 RepID=UPI0009C37F26|nr:hypothetical protein [Rhodovulum sp. P5]ARE40090.1 hypothetical protein RGUI_1949 [Rhodovulum sp. P5]